MSIVPGLSYDLEHAMALGRSWYADVVAMADAGCKRVIVPLRALSPVEAFCEALHARGMLARGVFDRTSAAQLPLPKWAARLDAALDEVQTGNEPDLTGAASWTMSTAELAGWLRIAESAWSQPTLYVAFGRNDPSVLQGLDLGRHLVSLHFYDMGLRGLLLDGYGALLDSLEAWSAALPGQDLDVAELGINRWNVALQRDYLYALPMLDVVPALRGVAWFCWADWMVAPFGLTDEHGTPKGELVAAYRAAAEGLMPKTDDPHESTQDTQIAFNTELAKRILEGKWDGATYGADSAEALLKAINPNVGDDWHAVALPKD